MPVRLKKSSLTAKKRKTITVERLECEVENYARLMGNKHHKNPAIIVGSMPRSHQESIDVNRNTKVSARHKLNMFLKRGKR